MNFVIFLTLSGTNLCCRLHQKSFAVQLDERVFVCPDVVSELLDFSSGNIWCGPAAQLTSSLSNSSSSQSPPSPSLPHSDSAAPRVSSCEQRNNSPAVLQWNMKPSLVPQRLQLWPTGTVCKGKRWDLQLPWRCAKDFFFLSNRDSSRRCCSL